MSLPGDDLWKTTPPDDWYGEEESQFQCDACEDIGWLDCNGTFIACTECSIERDIEDVMEFVS